jgi:hypothetical protein
MMSCSQAEKAMVSAEGGGGEEGLTGEKRKEYTWCRSLKRLIRFFFVLDPDVAAPMYFPRQLAT